MNSAKLGQKIKFFRERANLSQFELENEIGGSAGSISRIENGKVNPTKETILQISNFLNLNRREIDYLIGVTSHPVAQLEVDKAVIEVEDYFSKPGVYAYLICDRQRVWAVSDSFVNVFGLEIEDTEGSLKKVIGKNIIRIITDPEYKVVKHISTQKYEDLLGYNFARFYDELSFIVDDEEVSETMKYILSRKDLKCIWEKVQNNMIKLHTPEARDVTFVFMGIPIKVAYGREFLSTNPRFEIIEYRANNLLSKILKF